MNEPKVRVMIELTAEAHKVFTTFVDNVARLPEENRFRATAPERRALVALRDALAAASPVT